MISIIIIYTILFSNYATAGSLQYTIRKCSNGGIRSTDSVERDLCHISDICRVRLDYESFILDGPVPPGPAADTDANQATSGQCATDRMTVRIRDRQDKLRLYLAKLSSSWDWTLLQFNSLSRPNFPFTPF